LDEDELRDLYSDAKAELTGSSGGRGSKRKAALNSGLARTAPSLSSSSSSSKAAALADKDDNDDDEAEFEF